MPQTQTLVDASELGLPQIVGGNTGNIAPLLRTARKLEIHTFHKRPVCATAECLGCPYFRDNGSC